jgi:hypothetical protein
MASSLREKPWLGQLAGALSPDDTSVLNGNAQVVTDTPALRAGNVFELLYQPVLLSRKRLRTPDEVAAPILACLTKVLKGSRERIIPENSSGGWRSSVDFIQSVRVCQ